MPKISCDEVLSEIEHYLHGELPAERSAHLAEHLEACSPCLEKADFQRRLREIVRAKCHAAATPQDMVDRITERIRREGPVQA